MTVNSIGSVSPAYGGSGSIVDNAGTGPLSSTNQSDGDLQKVFKKAVLDSDLLRVKDILSCHLGRLPIDLIETASTFVRSSGLSPADMADALNITVEKARLEAQEAREAVLVAAEKARMAEQRVKQAEEKAEAVSKNIEGSRPALLYAMRELLATACTEALAEQSRRVVALTTPQTPPNMKRVFSLENCRSEATTPSAASSGKPSKRTSPISS